LRQKMDRVFGIIPSGSGPVWFVVGLSVVLLLVIGFIGFIVYSSKNVKFEVTDQGLRIGPSIYGRLIPRADLVTGGVKVIDLRVNQEYSRGGGPTAPDCPVMPRAGSD